jgi:hypothetical protein
MSFAILTFIVAISISGVAAYYSIIGLTSIFPAAFIPIIVMGIVLEIGKLITASWLYQNWKQTSRFLKTYLSIALVVLMLITSMGIFGFLSKSHIEQGSGLSDTVLSIEKLDIKKQQEERKIVRAEDSVDRINRGIDRSIDRGNITRAFSFEKKQRENLDYHNDIITTAQTKIDGYEDTQAELRYKVKTFEREIGPIKYIAELIYGQDAKLYLEKSVRGVILLIIFVFDPLAIALLIAANQTILNNRKQKIPVDNPVDNPVDKKKKYKPKKTEVITKDEYEEVVVEDEHGNQFKRYRQKVKKYFDDNWYKMEDSADTPEKFD